MAEFEGRAEFRICWQPFFLFSGVPDEGMPFLEHLRSIGGPDLEEKVAARKGLLFQRSEELGLNIDPQRPLGPSLLSHCLIDYAGRISADVQRDLVELIFEGNLALGELLSDVDFLLRMAERVGIDRESALTHIRDSSVQQAVIKAHEEAFQRYGDTKLPLISISALDKHLSFTGDLPADVFVTTFDTILSSP